MQRQEVSGELSRIAFESFFWFSRFEFALKENGYLQSHSPGADADPGWKEFVHDFQAEYAPTPPAKRLLQLAPKRQVVGQGDSLSWRAIPVSPASSELQRVAQYLKAVRNNLFHGGKHGGEDWDDKARNAELLGVGKLVLDDLAALGCFQGDYEQRY